MKRLVRLLLAPVLSLALMVAPTYAETGSVSAAGKAVTFSDVQPTVVDGVLMIPVRAVAEALGAKITWENGVVTVESDKATVVFTVGKSEALVNGHAVDLKAPVVLQNNRTLVPAGFLVTFYGQALAINDPALKSPEAMAYLEKAPQTTHADIHMTQQMTIDWLGNLPAGVPTSLTIETVVTGQVRNQEALLTSVAKSPLLPVGAMETVTALRNGKAYVKVQGTWQELPAFQGQKALAEQFASSLTLATLIREAHLGSVRTVDGKKLQDVVVTFDPAVLNAATNLALQMAAPQLPAEAKLSMQWDGMVGTISFDESGNMVSMDLDAAVTCSVTVGDESQSFRMTVHQTSSIMPNTAEITWPADLPK